MEVKKEELMNPRHMYLGNLFIVENGVGKASDVKYVVIRKKEHLFSKSKYFAYPGEIEVLVGCYEVSLKDEGIPFLVGSTRLDDIVGKEMITPKQVTEVIIQNNDPKKLTKLIRNK